MKLSRKRTPEPTRRQRVLRDAAQPVTFSYHARRSEVTGNTGRQLPQEEQPDAIKRSRPRGSSRLRTVGVLVLIVVLAIALLSLSTRPKIIIDATAAETPFLQKTSVYQKAASQQFASTILNHNKITVNTAAISSKLLTEFPELLNVTIAIPLLSDQPVVYVQPAQPSLILNASNGSFVLDSQGKVLQSVSLVPQIAKLNLPTVVDQSGFVASLHHQALTSNDVSFIQTVVYELAAKHVSVASFTLLAGTGEVDAAISGQPYYVKFNLENNDPQQQAGSFLALQAYLISQKITPARYIDVRVDGRVYYL
jgi:hypothetical protein